MRGKVGKRLGPRMQHKDLLKGLAFLIGQRYCITHTASCFKVPSILRTKEDFQQGSLQSPKCTDKMSPKDTFLSSTLAALTALPADSAPALYACSTALLKTFHEALRTSDQSMLPSYTVSLPKSNTKGTAIAIDLGGSTLRVAAIELKPHSPIKGDDAGRLGQLRNVLVRNSWSVGDEIKSLRAKDFFDWIAERVFETVQDAGLGSGNGSSVGVTWSFPVT